MRFASITAARARTVGDQQGTSDKVLGRSPTVTAAAILVTTPVTVVFAAFIADSLAAVWIRA